MHANTDNEKTQRVFQWLRYVMYFWSFRLSISIIGMTIPYLIVASQHIFSWLLQSTEAKKIALQTFSPLTNNFLIGSFATFVLAICSTKSTSTSGFPIYSWNESYLESDVFLKIKLDGVPALVLDVPQSDERSILMTFSPFLSPDLVKIKVADYPYFVYSNNLSAWQSLDRSINTYRRRSLQTVLDIQKTCNTEYFYNSFVVPSLNDWPLQKYINPVFSDIMFLGSEDLGERLKNAKRSANIWLSSRDVSVGYHYDTDHNFFLQVYGEKDFIVAEPSAAIFAKPLSILHPQWRQSRYTGMPFDAHDDNIKIIFEEDLIDHRKTNQCINNNNNDNNNNESIDSTNNNTCTNSNIQSDNNNMVFSGYLRLVDKKNGSLLSENDEFRIRAFRFRLKPGNLLYVPPFYFHSTSVVTDVSISMNYWIESYHTLRYEKLLKKAELPFSKRDSQNTKLANFAAVIREILADDRDNLDAFAMELAFRYDIPAFEVRKYLNESENIELNVLPIFCDHRKNKVSESNLSVKRSATHIKSLLNAKLYHNNNSDEMREIDNKNQIRRLLFMDFIDETLHSIFENESNPFSMISFVKFCLLKHK